VRCRTSSIAPPSRHVRRVVTDRQHHRATLHRRRAAPSAGTPPAANGATGDCSWRSAAHRLRRSQPGPTHRSPSTSAGFSLLRPNGTFLIVHGKNGTSTSIYDPVANTMSAGRRSPAMPIAARKRARRPNGTWLIVHGDRTTTSVAVRPRSRTRSSRARAVGHRGLGWRERSSGPTAST
jgi:hypothetical protein